VRDTTVPRFNPPAEPARTVGFKKWDSARTVGFEKRDSARTVGFGNQAASAREIPEEPGSERTRKRFDCERERERDWVWDRASVTELRSVTDGRPGPARKKRDSENGIWKMGSGKTGLEKRDSENEI